jgi:hypothetical protein
MALNVLRHNGPPRDSIRRRKLRAALNDDYRLRLLFGHPSPPTTERDCPGKGRHRQRAQSLGDPKGGKLLLRHTDVEDTFLVVEALQPTLRFVILTLSLGKLDSRKFYLIRPSAQRRKKAWNP